MLAIRNFDAGQKPLSFDFGFALLLVNGLITFIGLWLFKRK